MAEEKKIADEVMKEEELEQVVGGGYANVYFFQEVINDIPYYKVVKTNVPLNDPQDVRNLYAGYNGLQGYSIEFFPAAFGEAYARGYVKEGSRLFNADNGNAEVFI